MAEHPAGLSPVKLALAELRDLRARLDELERERSEPIAIVGLAGRFPGAPDADALWELLRDGRDGITDVPPDRWDVAAFFDEDPDAPGKMYTRRGGFLPQVDLFDAHFFGVSPREAVSMDPQQRLLLETAWRALEHAGIAPARLAGTDTGVFVGLSNIDYYRMAFAERDGIDAYYGSGTSGSVAAGRLSYVLGLRGPSLVVDTACSSSLVATHLACQSLRHKECGVALAGGVNLILSPDINIACSKARMMSRDGLCKTFDARADGYVRSEGCAVVVLKRLEDAERDGDRILAVIRGSAVNQDGRSGGLTVPNGPAQEAVIRRALASAGIAPHDVDYLEAHGTGTSLGDPIEVRALGQVFADRVSGAPLAIGSIKANVGHLEAAAGIAGLVKVVLALQNGTIPGHPHLGDRNPHLDWPSLPIDVVAAPQPWPAGARRRIAGVSSFGFSGTNAHVVVEEPPSPAVQPASAERTRHILAISARSPETLDELAADYARFLQAGPPGGVAIGDICMSANAGRSHFAHRIAVVGTSAQDIGSALATIATGDAPRIVRGMAGPSAPEVVFLFTGQGAQYAAMARTLYETQPAFRTTLDECDRLLSPALEPSLLTVLFGDESATALLAETKYAQPALFAVEYALAQLWRSWGVEPAALLGHSVGEFAAACLAGVFSLEDGLRLIAERGRLMQSLPDAGAMAAVFGDEATVRRALAGREDVLSIAALNGPDQVVISGDRNAMAGVAAELTAQGIQVRDLDASRAFHSPLLDPVLEPFGRAAAAVVLSTPRIPLVSNVTGDVASDELARPEYWTRHARQPVQFQRGIDTLRRRGHRVFIEIGPAPTLIGMARRFADAPDVEWLPSLRRNRDDWDTILGSLGALYVAGANVDWTAFDRDYSRRKTSVPGYRFQRQRYWLASDGATRAPAGADRGEIVHPLLGRRIETPLNETLFESGLGPSTVPYLAEHRVFGSLVFPATGYLEMAAAAARTLGDGVPVVEDFVIAEPLTLPDSGERGVHAVLSPRADGEAAFQVFSRTADGQTAEWHLHASAAVRVRGDAGAGGRDRLAAVRARCVEGIPPSAHYELFEKSGLAYGPAFRGIVELSRGSAEAVGRIQLPDATSTGGYALHPALLDSCFHVLLATLPDGAEAFTGQHFYLPVGVERLRVERTAGTAVWAAARLRPIEGPSPETFTGDLVVFDGDGELVATIDGLTAKRASAATLKSAARRVRTDWLYQLAWEPKPLVGGGSAVQPGDVWAVAADDPAVHAALTARFESGGARVVALDARLPLAGVVCAWTAEIGDATLGSIEEAVHRTSDTLLALSRESGVSGTPRRLVVATRGATARGAGSLAYAPLLALVRAFGAEHPDVRCASVDLPGQPDDLDALWNEIASPDGEDQVAYRGEHRHVARLRRAAGAVDRAEARAEAPVRLAIAERGILDNLRLEPLARREPGAGEVEIEVAASGLNFRDVLNALGMYPGDPGALGNECVGTITAVGPDVSSLSVGERVLALVHGGFQSYAVAPAAWAVPIPAGLDFDAAATIPMAFATAEYSLTRLAGLRKGERVLIHAATGGVGLAAVQIAQRAGAEIFATAGSDEKRAFLTSLGVRHVMNSRTVDFADEILARTNGEGVDVILNSLTGEAIDRSLAVLAKHGRFVEIGKRGIRSADQVAAVRPDARYHVVFLGEVEDAVIQSVLRDVAEAIAAGELRPLPRRDFSISDAVDAFRYMAQAKHIGKIVLTARRPDRASARGIRAAASYLITGGFGGLGLRIARALAGSGATHLVLVGRSAASDAARAAVSELEAAGAHVLGLAADVSREDEVARVLDEAASRMPPLAGIVHAAGVRADGVLAQMDRERFDAVLAPKVAGAWNLHRASERLDLDFFVMFSSAAAVLPSPGQGNYAAANAFLDALAQYRRERGLPALSIGWGPWDEVGMAAGLGGRDQQRWARHGVQFIAPDDGVRVFERLLGASPAHVAVVAADWRKFAEERAGGIPLIADLAGAAAQAHPVAPAKRPAIVEQVEAAAAHRRRDVVLSHVREQVRQVLALEPSFNLEPHQGLRDLGMDSLMALELRNRLQRSIGRSLPATLTFDRPTVAALASHLCELLSIEDDTAAPAVVATPEPAAAPGGAREPIAVVGIGCRMPGSVESSDGFWRLLHEGVDAIREVPRDRWDIDAYFDADPEAPGKMYTRYGGFIDRVDGFDPAFFGISPREAVSLDPQQRLLLEVAWEALEHAGQPADALLGTRSGVFVGISTYDYALLHMKLPDPAALDTYFGTGTSLSVAAGRLAYSLGLQGPCMAVDTACSSSLVAVHLACKSLRDRECRLALAGGVNLMLTPEPTVNGCRARMLSPDGRCKTFDASADGYVRGEGAGVVVLKRLSDAIADGDRVLALIRGSAVNQDGRSSGLTVPNGPSQQSVIRDALDNGGVEAHQIGYVEAHGTGTALGDPIEIEALQRVLVDGRPASQPLVIGSVKTNIGHLEAAAGVAGLIKVILAMRHGEIPAHLHFTTLNPHIAIDGAPLRIATERLPWPAGDRPRLAGVSSFGFSGTNAHVVVEEAPAIAEERRGAGERPLHLLTLSARSGEALRDLTVRYAAALETAPEPLADLAFTANAGRTHFGHRRAVVARSAAEAAAALRNVEDGTAHPMVKSAAAAATAPATAFLFTGQGSQYRGMGRQLFDTQPVFRDTMLRCDEILRGLLEVPLLAVLYGEDERAGALIDQTAYTQPALFAIEYALAELWRSWGIRPAAVLGHSVGEYVAAAVAGVFTLETGLRLIAARGRLMQALPPGSMAAVFASEAATADVIRPFGGTVSIAAINGPEHTVISGERAALDAAVEMLTARGVAAQRLVVSHAFHSASMDPMLDEFERLAREAAFEAPRVPLASNLTGRIAGAEIASAAYWRDHVRQPVRFAEGIELVRGQGCELFLEIGPRATLLGMARRATDMAAASCLASLRPPREDWAQMLDSVAALYVAGAAIDWSAFDRAYARRKVTLPAYPFQRERYWIAESAAAAPRTRANADSELAFCELRWRAADLDQAADPAARLRGAWIVLSDGSRLGQELAERIQQAGGRGVVVRPGAQYHADLDGNGGTAALDPIDPAQVRAFVAQVVESVAPVAGVVHLWPCEPIDDRATALDVAQARGCGALLHFVQAIDGAAPAGAGLFVVTRGACAARPGEPLNVAQAPVWGLARTIRREYPDLRGVLLDLPAEETAGDTDVVWRELAASIESRSAEPAVAVRGALRLVPRLHARSAPAAGHGQLFAADATYVITGGLGGLGLATARWIVERGARHLLLIGRRAPSPAAAQAIRELENTGARVAIARGDVADEIFVDGLLSQVERSYPPLRGIFHAAGVLDDGVLAQQDWTRFKRVLESKVRGAWVLHERTRTHALDLFVLFSSMAAIVGPAGQGSYAAANAFLDALAHHRRALGLPATCFNWGPWAQVGMAAPSSAREDERWKARGLTPMRAADALTALGDVLAAGDAQAGVLAVDWNRLIEALPGGGGDPLFFDLRRPERAHTPALASAGASAHKAGAVALDLESVPVSQRRRVILARVREEVAGVLGLGPRTELQDRQGLRELGLDSLMAIEVRNRLQRAVNQPLSATLAFDYPTVDALTDHLAREVFGLDLAASETRPAPAVRAAVAEPIAIIGMGCRMPGGGDTPESFWTLLRDGVDAISEVPPDRWDVDALYDPDPAAPGKMNTRWGGFLRDVDRFDAQVFGIAPREAVFMDPQQRLVLEVAWEALERAGLRPDRLEGSSSGVFIGISTYDYGQLILKGDDRTRLDAHVGTGISPSVLAGRLAYLLGLQGPAMAIDTACSSSLVAIHMACQSLRNGECRLALAGGVNLVLLPDTNIILSKARMLSPDGRCKTFDAAADGYVRGDGCGVVVLKRLSEALADGDPIAAVIRGSAINQDGRSSGLTVPNGPAQESLIRQALAVSGIAAELVSYVEAHGTGTPLGDPIELRALASALRGGTSGAPPVVIGSVKTNVGHLEAAAGIAGLLKAVLALQHREIPPHLHFREPNPHIDWNELPVSVPTEVRPWDTVGGRRIAGVSSFGFSGTNAHVVLEEAPAVEPAASRPAAVADRPIHALALSARTASALKTVAGRYADCLSTPRSAPVADVCFSANTGRARFNHRAVVSGRDAATIQAALRAFAAGDSDPRVTAGETQGARDVVFLFTGQGAQFAGMGRRLFETQPTFRRTLEQCDEILRPHLPARLLDVMYPADPTDPRIDDTLYTQPALFALEYALAELWRSWGVQPAAMIGHSLGEYTAACIAGVFSLEAGLTLSAVRGRLMHETEPGAMAALFAPEAAVRDALTGLDRIAIAAVNGPEHVVISGPAASVEAAVRACESRGVKARRLQVRRAFHSPLMDGVLDRFREIAEGFSYREPQVPIVSNLTGTFAGGSDVASADYWVRHLRGTVLFHRGLEALTARQYRTFLEIGPGTTLAGLGRTSVPDSSVSWLASLRPGRDDWQEMLTSLGALYVAGVEIDWVAFDRDYSRHKTLLPTYPFERKRYWVDVPAGRESSAGWRLPQGGHPLLGTRLDSAGTDIVYQTEIGPGSLPYLADHVIHGEVLLPASAYLEIALAAARAANLQARTVVEDFVIAGGMPLPHDRPRTVQTIVTPDGSGGASFRLFSRPASGAPSEWRLHAHAVLRPAPDQGSVAPVEPPATVRERCVVVDPETHYAALRDRGIEHGPSFRAVQELWRGAGDALGAIRVPEEALGPDAEVYELHPVLLDACLQVLNAAVSGANVVVTDASTYLPTGVDRVELFGPVGPAVWSYGRVRPTEGPEPESLTADVQLIDEQGRVVARLDGLRMKRAAREALRRLTEADVRQWLYEIAWQPYPLAAGTLSGELLIVGDSEALASTLALEAGRSGIRVRRCSTVEEARDAIGSVEATTPVTVVQLACVDSGADESLARLETAVREACGSVLAMAHALVASERSGKTDWCVVTRGAQPVGASAASIAGAPVWGLVRTIRIEHPDLRCACLDVDATSREDDARLLWAAITSPDAEDQIAIRQGRHFVARIARHAAPAADAGSGDRSVELATTARGTLENLRPRAFARRAPDAGEIEIEVLASGLNFRDVLKALDMYPGDDGPLGDETVGRVVRIGAGVTGVHAGQRVVALAPGTFRSHVTTRADVVAAAPESLSDADAATIPMAFLTAAYALDRLARLQAGERVLIHAGAGGVGLAALQIAQRAGAEIFATAGSVEKRAYLESLGVRHVLDSRTLEFEREIRARTAGAGVDVVLNSLAGEFIPASLALLGPGGRFLELGKTGIWTAERVGAVRPGVDYFPIYLGDLDRALLREMLQEIVEQFARGELRPLPSRVFTFDEARQAFRYMAQAKHIGKIVIGAPQTDPAGTAAVRVRDDATYLVTGGLGSLGLKVAEWLAASGARHVALMGRRAPSQQALDTIEDVKARTGAAIHVIAGDVSRAEDVQRGLQTIQDSMPLLRGVIHAAGVVDDGVVVQQRWSRFEPVLAPKLAGAWHLHAATAGKPLDFFVLFSSAAAAFGSPGQSNYAAANACLDALAHHRRARGLPALSINWGPWSEGGMAASIHRRDERRWQRQGISPLAPQQGLTILGMLLPARQPQVIALPVASTPTVELMFNPRRRGADAAAMPGTEPAVAAARPRMLADRLQSVPPARQRQLVAAHVREQVTQVLALEPDASIAPQQGLRDLGMDSLMAIELRNRLQASTGRSLPPTIAFDHPTIEALSAYLEELVLGAAARSASDSAPARPKVAAADVPGDAIAIVGAGCRFPGAATLEEFWRLLHEGVDAISEVPRDRWDIRKYFDPNPDAAGKMYTRFGGFVQDVDRFDPQFFGISPREAVHMDPQQRLLLEVSWEALEQGGHAPHRLIGSRTGVFIGISTTDYAQIQLKSGDASRIDAYFGTGNSASVAAGRLSYLLGLEGPSLAVDTACSSSLVSIHLACQSLRQRECDMALAGGVNLILAPEATINFCRARMLSPDGRCKTFDAAADGYVRGEGAGMVVLKRLSAAIEDGDRILAVIRASAVNQDGRSGGLTVPNGRSQAALIREALAASGVSPADVSYVEAHGTGTSLGDPIELRAISDALGDGRPADRALTVGSVKTNVGHLEAAAGIASVIKVVLALQHQEIPPHLHFKALNPHVSLDGFPLRIPTAPTPWEPVAGRRVAGVSSFAFSGTNAHLVLEEAPVTDGTALVDRSLHVVPLSAKSEAALERMAATVVRHLESARPEGLRDVAFTLGAGRSHFDHRVAIVAASPEELRDRLAAVARGELPASAVRGRVQPTRPQIGFLFTGQGAQYAGMGRGLYEVVPEFRRELDRCAEILRDVLDRPLEAVLWGEPDAGLIDRTEYTQPALFAFEYALAQMWRAWGVEPDVVLGHSLGEYVAACIADVFSVEDGLRLAAARGRLMQTGTAEGAMIAVRADERTVRAAVGRSGGAVAVAAINGPANVVVAGAPADVDAVAAEIARDGVGIRRLQVSRAFHSPLMDPMLDAFEEAARRITYRAPRLPVISNVTGALASDAELCDPGYWRRHVRASVLFSQGVETMRALGTDTFVEVGPGTTLLALARTCRPEDALVWLPSVRRDTDDWRQVLSTAAELYVRGVDLRWERLEGEPGRRKLALPTYPFERERYWIEDAGQASENASHWIYHVDWKSQPRAQQPPAPSRAATRPGTWLIFADTRGLGAEIARLLDDRGDRAVVVVVGDEYGIALDGSIRLNPSRAADFHRLIHEMSLREREIRGIVHLWGLDAASVQELSLSSLETDRSVRSMSVARIVQALSRAALPVSPRLFVVTRAAEPVGASAGSISLAQAPLWGLGRVVALENPEFWGGLIDLDPAPGGDDAAAVIREISDPEGEDQVAFRDGRRFVARLVRNAAGIHRPIECHPDATYLITGGVGGIGLRLAERLADRGARHLALTSRRGLPPRAAWDTLPDQGAEARQVAAIRSLERRGVEVRVAQVDARDARGMSALLEEIRTGTSPLRGIVHAAGIVRSDELCVMEPDSLHDVFAAKVDGSWILHELSRDLDLDFFVLFSSAAAIWGSRGLGSYAGANHFLDALSHYRRASGLPAVSINWGPWGEVGLASLESQRWLEQMGVTALAPDDGMGALEQVLASGATQAVAANVDWRVFAPIYAAKTRRRLLEELVPSRDTSGGVETPGEGELARRVADAIPGERYDLLIEHVQDEVAAVLGLNRSRRPSPKQGFSELGMDSLMAVELRNRLERAAGKSLPPTLAFDCPNIDAVARYLMTSVLGFAESAAEDATGDALEAEAVDRLSDDEVKALISGELEALSLGGLLKEDT